MPDTTATAPPAAPAPASPVTLGLRAALDAAALYVVTAAEDAPDRLLAIVRAACEGGADIVQLRRKGDDVLELTELAERCRAITAGFGALLIVDDRIDVAMAAGADGVHLGQEDLPLPAAQRLRSAHDGGWPGVIGCSVHSLDQALDAEAAGADYLGVGPVFATPTKPGRPPIGLDVLGEVASVVRLPWFAIGGVDGGTLPQVLAAGARAVAVVRAVTAAADPSAAARGLRGVVLTHRRAASP